MNCNNSCIFCSHDFNSSTSLKDMESDWLCSVMSFFQRLGGTMVSFSGGEPLCHPSLSFFVEKAKFLNLSTRITTNFLLFSSKLINLINNIDCVHISISVINPEIYSEISRSNQKLSLDNFLNNILFLISLGKKVRINSIYIEKYENFILESIKFFLKYDISINIMNNMFGNNEYMEKYIHFCKHKLHNNNLITYRVFTNPGWKICENCEFKLNCASTRAIWCFSDKSISLCPRKKIFYKICNEEYEILEFFKEIDNII